MGEANTATDLNGIAATLQRIEKRLERLEGSLEPITEISAQASAITATVADIADEASAKLGNGEERLLALRGTLELLTRPKTLHSLQSLVNMGDEIPNLIATISNIVDGTMVDLAKQGVRVDKALTFAIDAVSTLAKAATSPDAQAMMDPKTLRILGLFAKSFTTMADGEPTRVGAWGALKRMRDPDVQRSLGFILNLTGRFGQFLKDDKQLSSGNK